VHNPCPRNNFLSFKAHFQHFQILWVFTPSAQPKKEMIQINILTIQKVRFPIGRIATHQAIKYLISSKIFSWVLRSKGQFNWNSLFEFLTRKYFLESTFYNFKLQSTFISKTCIKFAFFSISLILSENFYLKHLHHFKIKKYFYQDNNFLCLLASITLLNWQMKNIYI
jgi:hypothetical protein